jgi:UDP-N-acetylmuramate--alanine ligase
LKKIHNIQNFYFLGIGGIGMSALARYFHAQGKKVAGYDKTATDLTAALEEEGIKVILDDEVAKVPRAFKDAENTLVVYTPAVPGDHKQYNYFKNKGFTVKKRAEVLGMITKDKFTLAVAGTHGKTTTTAILGHLLSKSGAKVTAFLAELMRTLIPTS